MALHKHQKLKEYNQNLTKELMLGIGGLESFADGFVTRSVKSKQMFQSEESFYESQETETPKSNK